MSALEMMQLGRTGTKITRLGMGCWAIGGHGWGKVNDEDSIRAIKCALDNGVTFFDTADAYGLGKSETLLAKCLGALRRDVVIASKGGVRWNNLGQVWPDISPDYLKQAVENSLRRLKLDQIPLYYIHKPDGITPIEASIEALARMNEEGKLYAIGVANFSADQLRQALQVAPITAVQIRLNIFNRKEAMDIIGLCKEHGITLVAWGALADGLLTGKFAEQIRFSDDDHRSRMYEFMPENFPKYYRGVQSLQQIARDRGQRISHLALRWVLDFQAVTCALFGAKTDKQVMENLGADGWCLSNEELDAIDTVVGQLSL